jgi:predicted RNA polymerase sigma factor
MAVEKLRSAAYPVQWMRLMMICCGMARKRKGMIAVRVRKMKTLTMKTESDAGW